MPIEVSYREFSLAYDRSCYDFTVILVLDAKDRDLFDPRIRGQYTLNLRRIDVLSATDDHVLEAAATDNQFCVLSQEADIAGLDPPIGSERSLGLFGHLKVAAHRIWRVNLDFA